jgi:hypothetical protein
MPFISETSDNLLLELYKELNESGSVTMNATEFLTRVRSAVSGSYLESYKSNMEYVLQGVIRQIEKEYSMELPLKYKLLAGIKE